MGEVRDNVRRVRLLLISWWNSRDGMDELLVDIRMRSLYYELIFISMNKYT